MVELEVRELITAYKFPATNPVTPMSAQGAQGDAKASGRHK